MSSAESWLTCETVKTGRTRSRKGNTNKHWEFMFQGTGKISRVFRRFFPEGVIVLPNLIIQRLQGRLSKS